MLIVKLGGSLYNSPTLTAWMQTLADYAHKIPIIIVPGGGPFADQVRSAQKQYAINDKTAHHMAILAMKQFGLMLADIQADCQCVNSHETALSKFSIWLPDDSLLDEPDLPHNWNVSSDSIALWLATKLSAQRLILIKSVTTDTASITELTNTHILDNGFSELFIKHPIDAKIMGAQDHLNFDAAINQPSLYLP